MIQLIPKQTAALSATYEFLNYQLGCSLQVSGDLGAETIPVNYIDDDDDVTDAYDSEGVALELSATNPSIPIHAGCKVVIQKGVTTNAVGVFIAGIKG